MRSFLLREAAVQTDIYSYKTASMAESAAVADGDQAFVALCYSNKIMGLSCYDELQNAIICDAFQVPTEELEETMINIKNSLHPTMFLLHPKIIANKPLLDIILAGPDGAPEAYRFKVLKSSVWSDKACNQRIHGSLTIKGQSGATSHCQRIASVVDLDSEQCRQTLGALIAYMQESVFKLDAGKVVVADVMQFSQGLCMQIDQGSFAALQIFAEEVHPNVMKGKGRSKEGFSLFGLFDRTHSLPGRQRLREWMSRPMCSKEKILHRQRGVALVTRQSNRDFIAEVCSQLRHFHDVPRLLLRVKKVETTFVEWCRLQSSLATSQKLLDRIGAFITSPLTDTADAEYVRELFHALDVGTVHRLAGLLQSAIDTPESEAQSCVVFREAYDAGLDRLRHTLDHLETHLVQAAHAVLEVVPLLQNVSVEYVPQVGYLVAVQEAEVHLLEHVLPSVPAAPHRAAYHDQGDHFMEWGDIADTYGEGPAAVPTEAVLDEGFRFVFKQSGVHYFKHRIVEELDASIGDIKSDIADRQRALLLQVEDTLLDAEGALQQLAISLSTLDALISLGALAVEQRLTAPEIVDESVILIKSGRHLLQELTVDNFVPNDAFISPEKNVALISGPNTSGKSVYLKQVGIIVYLAHIGSFVPCERARIGLTDRIMTRIASTETVSAPQSAFALDLAQVSRMLRYHTPRTLCLVDEFGKGTMPVDGIALLGAVVKHFAQRGGAALFVLHFTEILHDAVLSSAVMQMVSCFRMETLLQTSPSQEDEGECYRERTPLFTLKKGVATSSEGIPCARSAGVSEDVLRRAAEVKRLVSRRQAIQPEGTRSRSIVQNPRNVELLTLFLKTQNWAGDEGAANLEKFKDLL